MNTYTSITLGILLISATVVPTFGQIAIPITPDQSMVSMSESDLTALTKTLKKHKKAKKVVPSNTAKATDESLAENSFEVTYLRNRVIQLEQLLAQANSVQNGYSDNQSSSNDMDRYTQDKLDELSNLIQRMDTKNNQTPIVITTPNTSREREIVIQPNVADKTPDTDTSTYITQKIDSLYAAIKANKAPEAKNYTNEFDAMQNKLIALQNELATKKATPTNYEVLKSKYADYNKHIYFGNNSKVLNASANQIIDELVLILEANDRIDIIVKGFASDQGNPSYNEKLSMQRTEEVKRNLIIKGIHPTRVLTQYHGIDYKSPDATNARRVEISLLVRK